jgi:XTP/dITP diphosphohydrolase
VKRLLLATNNPGKRAELRELLKDLPLQLEDPDLLRLGLLVEERGGSYAANATLKARAYAAASGQWALADDSGLEVDALNGAPGPRSARLAGPGRSDEDRRAVLLAALHPHARPWSARFRCVAALSSPEGEVTLREGTCPGEVIPEARGQGGFGYDPIFLLPGLGLTMAQLDMETKNRISHRGRAMAEMIPLLQERLGLRP